MSCWYLDVSKIIAAPPRGAHRPNYVDIFLVDLADRSYYY